MRNPKTGFPHLSSFSTAVKVPLSIINANTIMNNSPSIIPEFISTDGNTWVFSLVSENGLCCLCSSTKLRNAVNKEFRQNDVDDASALHFKEAARMIIRSIKEAAGQNLSAITFSGENGKYLSISQKGFEHNFRPEDVPEPQSVKEQQRREILARLKAEY